jgi:hypothetical protein
MCTTWQSLIRRFSSQDRWTERLRRLRWAERDSRSGSLLMDLQLMDQDTLTERLRAGAFKPNCGLGALLTQCALALR